jgi:cellulose synthase/poly-beta-1,6-N-acetylglucosamine synthase-like glycosyltransferase
MKPWRLDLDATYKPNVSILIPMYNEEKTIRFKLENLYKISYPVHKLQIVLVNDASTDETLDEVYGFLRSHHGLSIEVLNRTERSGKANSLNFALKHATGDIAVVSDADCFWSSNTLEQALPYLSDSNVGAVAGREILLNPQPSWVTESELLYDNFIQTVKFGESRVHSTIFFQGGFAAYKKNCLDHFDPEADDSGTALNLVQRNIRTLLIPEAHFYTTFPISWKGKVNLKMRRANQLQRICIKCLKLLLQRKLVLPKRIAIPEIFLHIFNPLVFFALILVTALVVLEQPILLLVFLSILAPVFLMPRGRITFVETVQSNFILLASMASLITGRRFKAWKTVEDLRLLLNERILQEKHLI